MNQASHELAKAMKEMERASRTFLTNEMPIVVRVNGRPFPQADKNITQPPETIHQKAMKNTMLALCHHIQDCCLGYTFGNEISFLLFRQDGKGVWFDGDTEKITSSVAGLATLTFYKELAQCANKANKKHCDETTIQKFYFTATAFNLPLKSVDDYFLWRQNECIRKSVTLAAITLAGMDSQKIQGKQIPQLLKILQTNATPWESLPMQNRYGLFAVQKKREKLKFANGHIKPFTQNRWGIYPQTPRLYFEKSPFVINHLACANTQTKRR